MSESATAEAPKKGKRVLFPLRKRTGTASHHMRRKTVDIGLSTLSKFTPAQTVDFVAQAQWGSSTEMPCPHCGTIDSHYWRRRELRWKCKGCGCTFSVTSGTVFADHKIPLAELINVAYSWSVGASGVPALQIQRMWDQAYPAIFTAVHKLREGVARGFNVGIFAGIEEFDGMDINGRRHHEKRNRPLKVKAGIPSELMKEEDDRDPAVVEEENKLRAAHPECLEGGKKFVGPPKPPKFDKTASQPPDRRIMLVMRQRGIAKGKGASATRVAIALTESKETVEALAARFSSVESAAMTDEDNSYGSFAKFFTSHKTIKHSEAFSDRKGTNNNQAESFNKRVRRGERGIYLNASNKYLHEYTCEQAWREDTRKLSTGDRLENLLRTALFVGESRYFRGYIQGKHRDHELLVDGPKPAKARGRPKGWKPKPPI